MSIVEGKMKFSDLETILKSKTGEELNSDDIIMIQKSVSHVCSDMPFLSDKLSDHFCSEDDGQHRGSR